VVRRGEVRLQSQFSRLAYQNYNKSNIIKVTVANVI
jgi:hypothetical protein